MYDSLGGAERGGMTRPDAEQEADKEDCGQRALAWLVLRICGLLAGLQEPTS